MVGCAHDIGYLDYGGYNSAVTKWALRTLAGNSASYSGRVWADLPTARAATLSCYPVSEGMQVFQPPQLPALHPGYWERVWRHLSRLVRCYGVHNERQRHILVGDSSL